MNLGDFVPGIVARGVAVPTPVPVASLTLGLTDSGLDEAGAAPRIACLRAAAADLASAFARLRY